MGVTTAMALYLIDRVKIRDAWLAVRLILAAALVVVPLGRAGAPGVGSGNGRLVDSPAPCVATPRA